MGQDRTYNFKLSTIIAWVLLLVISQQLVTQWTVRAAGNRDVIDYISFAGTVVGLILAILAIVYSYLTTAAQRDDSQALRGQISNLNDAISRAQATGSEFTVQLERLDEIRQGIAVATSNTSAVLEASGRVENMLTEMRGAAEKTRIPRESGQKFEPSEVLIYLAERALPRQVVLYYLALIENIDKPDDREKNELIELVEPKTQWLSTMYTGEVAGYFWIFYDLDATLGQDEGQRKQMFEALLLRISKFSDSSYRVSQESAEGIRQAVELVEGRIRDHLTGDV